MPDWKASFTSALSKARHYAQSPQCAQLKQSIKDKLVPDQKNIQIYQEKYQAFEDKNKQGLMDMYQQAKEKGIKLKEQVVREDQKTKGEYQHQGNRFDFNQFFNGNYFNRKINQSGRTFGFYFLATVFLYSLGSNIPYAFVHFLQYRNQKRQFEQQLEMQGLLHKHGQ